MCISIYLYSYFQSFTYFHPPSFPLFLHSFPLVQYKERMLRLNSLIVPDLKGKSSKLVVLENGTMAFFYVIIIILKYSSSRQNFERSIFIMKAC